MWSILGICRLSTEKSAALSHHRPPRTHRNTIETADLFTTAAVPGRSAALDVCVYPPMQQPCENQMVVQRMKMV